MPRVGRYGIVVVVAFVVVVAMMMMVGRQSGVPFRHPIVATKPGISNHASPRLHPDDSLGSFGE